MDKLLGLNKATVEVLPTSNKWIGITYKEDLEAARKDFKDMIEKGEYPKKLWQDN